MTDQISTPGSNVDSSINASKAAAPKDKACPFCHQPFTSSSLGRHLDLYIKEKNPKPADGIHNVDEIKKLRGGITRRQPRNSTSRREGSTPGGTPGINGDASGKRSPESEDGAKNDRRQEVKSPTRKRAPTDLNAEGDTGHIHTAWHRTSWQATGVINDIPAITQNGDSGKWDREGNEGAAEKRTSDNHRTVSRHALAKATFDQKQKITEALDNARAAELALREVLGSIRAANRRVKPSASPFDYDPLTFDFPALTLHCLPPPPTLNQVAPLPANGCWSITPPDKLQYEALRAYFRDAFHTWRISRAITSSANPDDMLLYPTEDTRSSDDEAEVHAAAQELEEKISSHVHAAFGHWSSLSPALRGEIWRLELAKAVGQKDHTISLLRSDREKILQENSHLRQQVEQLSMCQQPREFQMMPPTTITISSRAAAELGNMAVRGGGIGLNISDKNETIDGLVKTAVGRWLNVVQTSRTNSGMASQRSLDQALPKGMRSQKTISQIQNQIQNNNTTAAKEDQNSEMELDVDADAEADADVDAEGEEAFEIPNSTAMQGQMQVHAPEAPMRMMSASYPNHDRKNGNANASMEAEGRSGQYNGNRAVL